MHLFTHCKEGPSVHISPVISLTLWVLEHQGCVYTQRGRSFFYDQCYHSIWISTLKPIRKWHRFRICFPTVQIHLNNSWKRVQKDRLRIQVFVQTLQKSKNSTQMCIQQQLYYCGENIINDISLLDNTCSLYQKIFQAQKYRNSNTLWKVTLCLYFFSVKVLVSVHYLQWAPGS